MTAPNMATITESLERSLQNCSLNQSSSDSSGGSGSGVGRSRTSSTSDSPGNHHLSNSSDTALELNSQISLPYHWEQCLDLKTGEIYYINWRTGMRANDDPRTTTEFNEDLYSDEEEEEDDSSYDSEGSTSEYSTSCSRDQQQQQQQQQQYHHRNRDDQNKDHVLVVAGCKSCLMYFMVPKQVLDCPKCGGQLLHFDRSENGSP